jgi:hypothetical protein
MLPGRPEPYFLKRGEGEHAMLFADLFTVLLTGDETDGQFGVFTSQAPRGQLIPAHAHHRTHEVFYIAEGGVRVYIQDRDGTKTSQPPPPVSRRSSLTSRGCRLPPRRTTWSSCPDSNARRRPIRNSRRWPMRYLNRD